LRFEVDSHSSAYGDECVNGEIGINNEKKCAEKNMRTYFKSQLIIYRHNANVVSRKRLVIDHSSRRETLSQTLEIEIFFNQKERERESTLGAAKKYSELDV